MAITIIEPGPSRERTKCPSCWTVFEFDILDDTYRCYDGLVGVSCPKCTYGIELELSKLPPRVRQKHYPELFRD